MKEPIFKATHIVKQFGPTIALNDVDIEIYPGEIRGFIGENGSGKSTMSAIMTGIYERTSGTMEFHGKPWEPKSMIEALNGVIGIIVQENGTIGNISVAENIYLGELDQFSGRNYFEEYKVEDFSRMFDLSLNEFDELKKAYVEVLEILNHMDPKYKKMIPEKLLKQMETRGLEGYEFKLDTSIPFKENKFSSKTLPLLAMINLNYWCKTPEEKQAQREVHEANDKKQEVQSQSNDTAMLKREEIVQTLEETNTEPFLWLELPEDTWFEKLIYRIKYFFKQIKWRKQK